MKNIDAEVTILIVDDDPGTIRVLSEILNDFGRIIFTTQALEAYDLAKKCKPDLILLDIEMPKENGISICRKMKSDPYFEYIPVLHVTSHRDMKTETLALSSGAIDYISKPPNPDVVQARVRNYLAMKEQAERLIALSSTDGLTGIANRREFDQTVDIEWKRSCRERQPLSLLMIDVDYFKAYNDNYGHKAGDECLCSVARALENGVRRPGELVARYGGEEFAILVPHCSHQQAHHLADRVCSEIYQLAIPHGASKAAPYVTVSIGVATNTDICSQNTAYFRDHSTDAINLVELADKALYDAKRLGRNRAATLH